MLVPEYITQGDVVGIVSTARKISAVELNDTIHFLKEKGYEVKLGKHLFEEDNQFAGSDSQRAEDLQHFINDPAIKAILCARGGYGTVRLIDKIDFAKFRTKPKWLIGYSDITVLHCHVNSALNVESLHAIMPLNIRLDNPDSLASANKMIEVLEGKPLAYTFHTHLLNRTGSTEGEIIGGNLSVLYSLMGSVSFPDTNGKILFIEDIDEYLYHIDRMMMALRRAGKLNNLAGLIVGGFTDMKDNTIPFGKTAEEIISEAVSCFDYPVCFNFPAGHLPLNLPLIMGRKAKLNVSEKNSELIFQ